MQNLPGESILVECFFFCNPLSPSKYMIVSLKTVSIFKTPASKEFTAVGITGFTCNHSLFK